MGMHRPYDGRLGVVLASTLGFIAASYFELEARGVVPNLLASRAPLVAGVFSEQVQVHVSTFVEPWVRALAFAMALLVSLVAHRSDEGSPMWLRLMHASALLTLPVSMLILTLVAQPLMEGDLCAPCLLESLFALAILEFRARPLPPYADETTSAARRVEEWHGRGPSPSMSMRRLGRDDAHR